MPVTTGPRKYIYDPVHGSISLTGPTLELIGHPLLQRLWGIRQTGLANLVFPGASHTRLEHSLGVLWVVRTLTQGLGLEPSEALPLEVAGFLHDLGHTPFSHTLEPVLEEVVGEGHEAVTASLILGRPPASFEPWLEGAPGAPPRSIPEVLERHHLSAKGIATLLEPRRPRVRPYRSEMLHGSIDADRLDYLQRDAHYTGVAHGVIDANRLLETVRVEKGHLVFAEKSRPAVEGFLVARSLMYSSVYYNKTVRLAEVMLQSAVERLPEYPHVRGLLGLTDAELLGSLEARGGRPREMARRLKLRQLFKRAVAVEWKAAAPLSGALARRSRTPAERRGLEDALADELGVPFGSVLVDLAATHRGGHVPGRPSPPPDPLWIRERGEVVDLLRKGEVWHDLLARPITPWAVALYASPEALDVVRARGSAALSHVL